MPTACWCCSCFETAVEQLGDLLNLSEGKHVLFLPSLKNHVFRNSRASRSKGSAPLFLSCLPGNTCVKKPMKLHDSKSTNHQPLWKWHVHPVHKSAPRVEPSQHLPSNLKKNTSSSNKRYDTSGVFMNDGFPKSRKLCPSSEQ